MKSAGRTRQPEQTQQEFVDEVASELSLRLKDSTLDAEVQSIAGLFYRVRFGDGELTADETARLDRILARLEQALGPDEGRRAQPA